MKKTVCMLLCLALLLPCLSGCGDTEPLQVWCTNGTQDFAKRAVFLRSQIDDRTEYEVTVFEDEAYAAEGMALTQNLRSQLMAGEGPDLILFTKEDFTDIRKLAESGSFLDLGGYLEDSEKFDPADYAEGIMQDGWYDDAYFYVPLGYSVYSAVTTREAMEYGGWETPANMAELLQQMGEYGAAETRTEYFFDPISDSSKDYIPEYLLLQSGVRLIDAETGMPLPDEEGLRRVLEGYKAIRQSQFVPEMPPMHSFFYGDYFTDHHVSYMLSDYPLMLAQICTAANAVQETELFCIAGFDGNVYGEVSVYAAVNAYSKDPDAAWALLETMLGSSMQSYILEENLYTFAMPVRRGCLEAYLNGYYAEHEAECWESLSGETCFAQPLNAETVTEFAAQCESAQVNYLSPDAFSLLWECMEPYFEDTDTYESCLEDLRSRLNLYAME
ncbi:MAG: extracellular solute-binding protein [Oscillospiraceae bacterium]|nr:extracellular solute-binding protein [Oscillospiraceae bacterium]